MADPFLQGHLARTRIFDLGRRTPVSIRDQLLRADYLVERLVTSRYLHSKAHVLVIGAGVAGVSTAIYAARQGATVVLIVARPHPITLQSGCRTRWVDPSQYDWPAEHANAARWPPARSRVAAPLGFSANFADQLAIHWANVLVAAQLTHGARLKIMYGATVGVLWLVTLPSGITRVSAEVTDTYGVVTSTRFNAVIFARGFSGERTTVPLSAPATAPAAPLSLAPAPLPPEFTGQKFWEDDTFETANFGLPASQQGDVLVSGAGDGALQDYIRLTTGRKSAIEILNTVLPRAGSTAALRLRVQSRAVDIENQMQRAMLWNGGEEQDHRPLMQGHAAYRTLLAQIARSRPKEWTQLLDEVAVFTSGRGAERVYLFHGCDHFSVAYGLNHLVTLLIDAQVTRDFGSSRIGNRARIETVSPTPNPAGIAHHCPTMTPPVRCWGHPHVVEVSWGGTCGMPGSPMLRPHAFDGVVIRHGVRFVGRRLPPIRQVLPLHVPEP